MEIQKVNIQHTNPAIAEMYNGQKLNTNTSGERLDINLKQDRGIFQDNNGATNKDEEFDKKRTTIIDAIEKTNATIKKENQGLEFSIHEATNQIMIKVIDKDTNEVVKEIPSEKILDMLAKIIELSGEFIDEKR